MLSIQDMNNLDRLVHFVYGLKPFVKKEVERHEPTTLSEAIKLADKLGAMMLDKRKKYVQPFGLSNFIIDFLTNNYQRIKKSFYGILSSKSKFKI